MSGSPENMEIPNKADQLNPAQGTGNYWTTSIDRGCSPSAVAPFGYQLHYARYVNPEQWRGLDDYRRPGRSSSRLEGQLLHVGCGPDQPHRIAQQYSTIRRFCCSRTTATTPGRMVTPIGVHGQANGRYQFANYGAVVTATNRPRSSSIFPTSRRNTNDIVHVEDGGWVYADQDFGSPIMVDWLWPPRSSFSGINVVDPSTASVTRPTCSARSSPRKTVLRPPNKSKTTLTGYTNRIDQIRDPWQFRSNPQRRWNSAGITISASLDSGFMYYGCSRHALRRAVVAQSNAVRNVDSILNAQPALDTTPPTVFIPQRYP